MARKREQISLRLDVRIIRFYTELAEDYQRQWKEHRRPGTAPTRNWFMEQTLGQGAQIPEAIDWKESDDEEKG